MLNAINVQLQKNGPITAKNGGPLRFVINGVTYYNDGDWVESCTALVEHADGRMEIVDWATRTAERAKETARGDKQGRLALVPAA